MKYNRYIISFFVLFPLIGSGCAPIYYPSTPNTPMLKEAEETQLAGRVGSSAIAGDPDFDWNPLYVSTGVSFRFGGSRDDVTVID